MSGEPRRAERLASVQAAFSSLPDRYLGAAPDFDATYHVVLGDVGHVWEVRCNSAAHVHRGATRRKPDVTIATDSGTWGPQPDLGAVYDHLIKVMQRTLDGLAAERRLPLIG
jgi:hypothetical protein